jgi:hypothetical protein
MRFIPPVPQVYDLFRALAPACGLKAGLAAAQSSPAEEAAVLVGPPGMQHQGVDILVATPGRLMAHLQGTAGLNLQVRELPGSVWSHAARCQVPGCACSPGCSKHLVRCEMVMSAESAAAAAHVGCSGAVVQWCRYLWYDHMAGAMLRLTPACPCPHSTCASWW